MELQKKSSKVYALFLCFWTHGGLKNINITRQNTVGKKKKKKNLYTKISYYILVMNISMDEFVRIGIDSHEIHTDEVKMHCAQVRLMFAFWRELFSICFFFFSPFSLDKSKHNKYCVVWEWLIAERLFVVISHSS